MINIFSRLTHKELKFDKIVGYEDVKDVINRALDSDENLNILLDGPPASAKSLFLREIQENKKDCLYFDATNSTGPAMLDTLNANRGARIILIDELEKMARNFQNMLLNMMETGHISVIQMKRRYDFTMKDVKIFATSNDVERISRPMLSRFRKLTLPEYTKEEFLEISARVLPKLHPHIAKDIAQNVWNIGSKDIRNVISIGKLVRKHDGPVEIESLIETMEKYK
jgi:replication-associated recombination protein RarA